MGAASSASSSVTRAPSICASKHVVVKWAIGGVAHKGALDLSTAETTKLTCTDLLWEIRDSYGGQPPGRLVLDVHLALNLTNAQGENFARFVGCISHAGAQTGRVIEFVIHPPCTCPGYGRIKDGCLAFCAGSGIDVKWKVVHPPEPARVTDAPGAPPRPGDDADDADASGNVAPARRAIQRADRTNPLERSAGSQRRSIKSNTPGISLQEHQHLAHLDAYIARDISYIRDTITRYNTSSLTRTITDEDNAIRLFETLLYEHRSFSDMRNEIQGILTEGGPLYVNLFFMIIESTTLQAKAMSRTTSEENERTIIGSAVEKLRIVLKYRYIAYVLDKMTGRDAAIWFVILRPFYEGCSGRGTLLDDYDYYEDRNSHSIRMAITLDNHSPHYYTMYVIIGNVNSAIKRELETGVGDIDSIHRHLRRLETAVWWLFCKHRRADYVDAGGSQAILDEYAALARVIMHERQQEAEANEAIFRPRLRPALPNTELRYDQSVEDTIDPAGEDICCVCLERRRIVTAVPCMHKDFCAICAVFVVKRMYPDVF
jgi:hypothetical protein